MILYFSATGNTEYIAQEVARRLNDECINLLDRIKKDDHSVLHSDTPFIICAPVYVCEMPRFMSKYLKNKHLPEIRMFILFLPAVVIAVSQDNLQSPSFCFKS